MSNQPSQDIPVYIQVANILRSHIVSPGTDVPSRLPSERSLAETLRVARGTIRQALQLLASEGLIHQGHGQGTLTIPAGIAAWRNLHKSRVLQVVGSYYARPEAPADFYGQIYQGILVRSEERGYQVTLEKLTAHYPPVDQQFVPADRHRVAGVITIGLYDERYITMHTRAGYPVLCTDYWPAQPLADGIVFDCYGEGQQAAELLLGLGHRTFFYLGNNHIDFRQHEHHESDADLMEAGFRRALLEAAIELPPSHIRFQSMMNLEEAARWFLSLDPRPTAGLVFSQATSEGLVKCLRTQRIICPRDLSLVCKASASDSVTAAHLSNDPFVMGAMAVDMLLERISGKRNHGIRVALPSTLHHGPTIRSL